MKVMLTGATGMVGAGVLAACLQNPAVAEVLSVSRRPCGVTDPKLKELLAPDFLALTELPQGYDACFYCAGVSSVGMSEADYTKASFDTPLHFAELLQSPGTTFIYITGASTDGTEQGRVMWARVKGRAENALMKLAFKGVYNFRPAMMKPVPGQLHVNKLYGWLGWTYPLWEAAGKGNPLTDVAQAMVNAADQGYEKHVLEVRDIKALAAR